MLFIAGRRISLRAGGPQNPQVYAYISSNEWVAHSCAFFAQEWEPRDSPTNIPGSINQLGLSSARKSSTGILRAPRTKQISITPRMGAHAL